MPGSQNFDGRLDQDCRNKNQYIIGWSGCLDDGSCGDHESTIPIIYFWVPCIKKLTEPMSLLIKNARGSRSRTSPISSGPNRSRDCTDINGDCQNGNTPPLLKPSIVSDDCTKNALTTAMLESFFVAVGLTIASGGAAPRAAWIQPKASTRLVTDLVASFAGT